MTGGKGSWAKNCRDTPFHFGNMFFVVYLGCHWVCSSDCLTKISVVGAVFDTGVLKWGASEECRWWSTSNVACVSGSNQSLEYVSRFLSRIRAAVNLGLHTDDYGYSRRKYTPNFSRPSLKATRTLRSRRVLRQRKHFVSTRLLCFLKDGAP